MQNQALEPGDEQVVARAKILACTTLNPDWADRLVCNDEREAARKSVILIKRM
jgi:hypothetical protein